MTLGEVLDKLYQSEINFHVSCFWDNSIEVKLGDEMNGFSAEGNVAASEEAAAWLDEQARLHFPKSRYARGFDPPGDSGNNHR
jgi:hypothetical protein